MDLAFATLQQPPRVAPPPLTSVGTSAATSIAPQANFATKASAVVLGAAVLGARRLRLPRSGSMKGQKIVRQAEDGETAEAEAIFREAYEAEAERAKLLSKQVEAALAEQLGAPEGIKINVEAPAAPAPGEPGGSTWRAAYEDVKKRTASLESQLTKARRMAEPAAPAAATAQVEDNFEPPDVSEVSSSSASPNFQQPQRPAGEMEPMQQMQKLREVANIADDEESVLRLLSLAALPNQENLFSDDPTARKELPSLNQAREALSNEDFVASDALVFERCYVFPGAIPSGRDPATALDSMQSRMRGLPATGAAETELFLQRQKEEGKSLLIMIHKSDLPEEEMESWQWVIWVLLVGATFFASMSTPLAVVALGPGVANGTDVTELTGALDKLVPVAGIVLATVAAQETARRTVASSYGVQLTPPYLLPALPIGSIGCLGAVTRRLSTAPNREAEVNMSLAAPIAGLIVSLGFVAAGVAMGPGSDTVVNLNYQLLPVLVKFALRPFLGQSSVTTQPDPFADPTALAFAANPILIGGVCGLILTALTLLPIGRLDGGVLARNALGGLASPLGLLATALVLYGSFGPGDAGSLYLAFGVSALIWFGGAEAPPKEAINGISAPQQVLAVLLVFVGLALAVPGYSFPQI
ncbi:EGY3 [Symbiodinium natans]|uniref:EGY3 protein n=1 Tax=Symbiodinium natans TaxID=878477 RepID=A0A812H3V7_9DINO|nr:EGY3 [Symbiodinium natans]